MRKDFPRDGFCVSRFGMVIWYEAERLGAVMVPSPCYSTCSHSFLMDSDEFFFDLIKRSGLVKAVALDGSVWWVRPEMVSFYENLKTARLDGLPIDAPLRPRGTKLSEPLG